MKTYFAFLAILFITISNATLQSYARSDKPIVLSRKRLSALRNSVETRTLKDNIDKILSKKTSCTNCADIFESASNAKAFIVVEKESNGFGGSFVLAVFAKTPNLYRFWLYPIDSKKNEFEIREAVVLRSLNNELMSEITKKEYADYWTHL